MVDFEDFIGRYPYLEAFDKRMEFAAVVDSIVNRKNSNTEIEGWFPDKRLLDNLFFSLLVYIMEQTLSENEECTIENMADHLSEILPQYLDEMLDDGHVRTLTEYMVKDILQNKGEPRFYPVMDYSRGIREIRVRLVSDRITDDGRIIYQLTDQGYNFLFRTREVDQELDFQLEQLKLRELLKRRNYRHAVSQSRQLIAMLRQKKKEISEFIYRVMQDVHAVESGEYERLLDETYSLIDQEYSEMQDIKKEVDADERRIRQQIEETGRADAKMEEALRSLTEISRNLRLMMEEQRNLIADRFRMNRIYEDTIINSFETSMVHRYDFEKEILKAMTKVPPSKAAGLTALLRPLLLPRVRKQLSLLSVYAPQGALREEEEDFAGEGEDLLEDDTEAQITAADNAHAGIFLEIVRAVSEKKEGVLFSELFEKLRQKLSEEQFLSIVREKRIFLVMLRLYENGAVDFEAWDKAEKEPVTDAGGEFDIAVCLTRLKISRPDFFGIRGIRVQKTGEKAELSWEERAAEPRGSLKGRESAARIQGQKSQERPNDGPGALNMAAEAADLSFTVEMDDMLISAL